MMTGNRNIAHDSPVNAPSSSTPFPEFYARINDQPIYVVLGVQGSGTNLLRSILVNAFNFAFVKDQALIYNAAARLGERPSAEAIQQEFAKIRRRLFPSALTRKTSRRIKTNSSYAGIVEQFAAADIRSAADFARFVYAYGAYTRGTPLMAIKSDDLWETIGHIDNVLPNRRIILLTRDFRDNLLSIANKDFGPIEPLVAARYVKDRFAFYDAEFRRTPPERRLHVKYEELLEAPDAFVSEFARHFGLTADGELPPPVNTGRIRRNNTRKWAGLPPRELAQCEAILREELHRYGYGTECEPVPPPGPATWLMAKGRDTAKRVPQKFGVMVNRLRR
jgi:hypothetical protein